MVNKRVVIVDGNQHCYRMYHKMPDLRFGAFNTGIIYGFVQAVHGWVKGFNPQTLIICWDGGVSKERRAILPGYKVRDKKDNFDADDFYFQRKTIIDVLNSLNVIQYLQPGVEADDYVYALTRKYRKNHKVIIASRDKDFKPLIGPNVKMWDDHTKRFLHSANFERLENIKRELFLDMLCITGDKSDKIPGYPGVGEANVRKILAKGNLKQFLNDHSQYYNFVDKSKLEVIYKRNRRLINLHYYWKKWGHNLTMQEVEPETRKYDPKLFKIHCDRLGFRSFRNKTFYKPFLTINKTKIL